MLTLNWTGGAFDYYELDAPLFQEDGNLNEEVGEDKIREYIFFSETQQNLPEHKTGDRYFPGNLYGTAYYFYYERNFMTILSHDTLRQKLKQLLRIIESKKHFHRHIPDRHSVCH